MAHNKSGARDEPSVLRKKKVMRMKELQSHLDCSRRTVQRRLADWNAIRSYNRNGSYYTLPDIPAFDANGLWRHQGVFFSKFGNLPETFVHLVAQSPAGLTAAEAGELLGLRPSSFLWSLREHPQISREKSGGRFVYYCADPGVCGKQRQRRRALNAEARQPTPAEAVAILVEKIKRPKLDSEEISRRLRKQNLSVSSQTIENLFIRHGIAVKKTPHSI